MTARRVQRTRVAGRPGMPVGAVYVGRPSRWGNPAHVGRPCWATGEEIVVRDSGHAVALFREYLSGRPDLVADIRAELSGRDLACWCPLSAPCHGDVLVAVAAGADPAGLDEGRAAA